MIILQYISRIAYNTSIIQIDFAIYIHYLLIIIEESLIISKDK